MTINANMSDACEWTEEQRNAAFFEVCRKIYKLLRDANVNSVYELIGKPVEVIFENNMLRDYRILTEVL